MDNMNRAPRRGRPRGRAGDAAGTRRDILEAVQRLLAAKGLARLTTQDIAREAQVAEGTIFKHFAGKADVILAVVQANLPQFTASTSPALAGQATVEQNLWQIARAALEYFGKLIPVATALFADRALLTGERAAMRGTPGPQRNYEHVAAYIRAEQALGRLDSRWDAFGAAALLLGACFQYAFLRHLRGSDPLPMTEEQFVGTIVGALLHPPLATHAAESGPNDEASS
jgi:AcrR family transcriptional regulator